MYFKCVILGCLMMGLSIKAFADGENQFTNGYFEKTYQGFIQYQKGASPDQPRHYMLGPGDTVVVTIPKLSDPAQVPALTHAEETSTSDNEEQTGTAAGNAMLLFSPISTKFQQAATLQSDGSVYLSPFGAFRLEGLTLEEARTLLTKMTSYYIKDPQVYVQLKTMRPVSVYVTGRVYRPGSYTAADSAPNGDKASSGVSGNPNAPMRLSALLGKVGGVLYDADVSHVRIFNPQTGDEQTVDLLGMLDPGGHSFADPVLYPDDHVDIPQVPNQMNWSNDELAASTLSQQRFTVRVLGYASKGGGATELSINPRNRDLWSALSQANVDPKANLHHIVVLRKTPQGGIQQLHADSMKDNIALQPNDLIVLPSVRPMYKMQDVLSIITQVFFGVAAVGTL